MFGSWSLVIPGEPQGSSSSSASPAVKRARLTSLTFPRCLNLTDLSLPPSSEDPAIDSLFSLFHTIKKPNDITREHLKSLRCSFTYDLPLSSLIPKAYHPDETNPDSVFNQRKKEVEVDNQAAFDSIARRRRDVKIGSFYKFFQAVEMIEFVWGQEQDKQEKAKQDGNEANADGNTSDTQNTGTGNASSNGSSGAGLKGSAKFREELLRNFVDPIGWGCEFRVYQPRYPPKLMSKRSLFNIKADFYIYQQPSSIPERREGIVIGPAIIMQTRNEENYTEVDDVTDAVLELTALLHLAQERSKKDMHKKVRYTAVGKDKSLNGDDLFLISSVQTHLSISHVFLTDAYIKFIRTGELPPEDYQQSNPEWNNCRIGKSRWYNLMEADGRVDALRSILAVMNWIKRDEVSGAK